MISRKIGIVLLALASISITSCSNDSESDLLDLPDGNPDNGDLVTYSNDVKSIIDSNCLGCHSSPTRNGAPFALINFSQVSSRANSILTAMSRANGTPAAMPPSGKLPQATIDIIDQWIKDGTQE
ncbi:hypothetical protein [Maribacter sp. 2307UL18-2]|uniref:hypothetical protein n=1 Tax=Maribacter sp. 2307UL18-2 TaxID=3386274 RepID=UPI0039BCB936